jgi:TRAP-type C4-dicarboxylate transport system substrate-binding protein
MRYFLTFLFALIMATSAQTTIKFATLAPEGSTWMNVMNEYANAIKEQTQGKVKFKIYPGGIQGDELDVIRRIRNGQLHSAGFTGVGLGEILPEVRILDSPFLFKSYEEVDYVSKKLFDLFAQHFEEKGYVLLGWAEVGFVYVFTNMPINKRDDMAGVKMWMWEGDPIAEGTFKAFNLNPIPLSITDVLTSLQTGLIDGVYTSPLACVALQWHTKVKYMLELPLADSQGAVLISRKYFEKLDSDQQLKIKEISTQYFNRLTQLSREDNAKSLELIKDTGIIFTTISSKAEVERFNEVGAKARKSLIGKLYDASLLDQVQSALSEFRAGSK